MTIPAFQHSAFQAKPLAHLVQILGILLLRPWMRFGFGVRVRTTGPLPVGACIYASNHRSFADPTFIAMWSRVPCSFFARSSLWRILPVRLMLDLFQGIPVDRDQPGMAPMKHAIALLRGGMPVIIFPEGTRTRDGRLGPMKDGPALFARRAGVPLIPVYVHRTEACWPRGSPVPRLTGARLEIRFGRAISAPPGLSTRDADVWVTRRLTAWMHRQERALLRGPPGSRPNRALPSPRPP